MGDSLVLTEEGDQNTAGDRSQEVVRVRKVGMGHGSKIVSAHPVAI